ncbi:ParA family protein [Streptomyces hydrogenans]
MARRVVFVNNKCGVGKSTTTVRLAEALAKEGKRVLVVDMDPQGNASSMLGWVWDPAQQQPTISHAIQAAADGAARTVIQPIAWDAPTPSASRSPRPPSTWRAGCPRPVSPAPGAASTWPSTASTPTSTTRSSTASPACST